MAIYSIYKFTNVVNGKVYIGKTVKDPETRKIEHFKSAKFNAPYALHRAIRKYGEDNFKFETIFNTFFESDLNIYEQFFISSHHSCVYDPLCNGYNMTYGGDGIDSVSASANNQARIANGTHNWSGKIGSQNASKRNNARIANGTHQFLTDEFRDIVSESNKNRDQSFLRKRNAIVRTCPYCNLTGKGPGMIRYHFDNCKVKP